jgi:dienelactone hydrolase
MSCRIESITAACLLFFQALVLADGPADNLTDNVRRIPKPGIEVPAEKKAQLEAGLNELRAAIDELRKKNLPPIAELLPDVEIFHKSVHDALVYQEFFDPKELDEALKQLAAGKARAAELAGLKPNQRPSWAAETGLVVRGYVSKIDGSIQPYGLVVPESYSAKGPARYRTDVWLHGRGETLSELNFLRDRMNNPGTFTPDDTIVLHPYGRYCNAFKFAGEIDVFEALDSVKRRYRVDEDRIAIRGFSMGGAGVWHLAVHYPDQWFAANPGAGFSETPEFLKVFQKEELKPAWWEQSLWQMYDCPVYALNLRQLPTIAYSGELDSQKQAADVMEETLLGHDMKLTHIIGPQTKHAYHPQSRIEVEQRMASLARAGRTRVPRTIELETYTLRYNRSHWLVIDALKEHWRRGYVAAEIVPDGRTIDVRVSGVTEFTLDFPTGDAPFDAAGRVTVAIGGWQVNGGRVATDRSFRVSLVRKENGWEVQPKQPSELRKSHGLQGPIDDALLDSFLFVRPTGKSPSAEVNKWVDAELTRAIEHWRRHFRGEPRVKDDTAVTAEDFATSNLVVWGDSHSNSVLRRADQNLALPLVFYGGKVGARKPGNLGQDFGREFPCALIMIYPNPLNPSKYLVLNSSFTFRDYAYLNNARQVPMLPDWAVVDLTTPPNAVWPGKIVAAGFFDEKWQLKPPR